MGAINRWNCWIWEVCLHEVLHIVLIGECECWICFQSNKNVVNISVWRSNQWQTMGHISSLIWIIIVWTNANWWLACTSESGLYLTSIWASITLFSVTIITNFTSTNSSITTNDWSVISTNWWLTTTYIKCLYFASVWASISRYLIFIITWLTCNNNSITTISSANIVLNDKSISRTRSTYGGTWACLTSRWACKTSLSIVKVKSSSTINWLKYYNLTNSINTKILTIWTSTSFNLRSVN